MENKIKSKKQIQNERDLLTIGEVSETTWATTKQIIKWCREGKITKKFVSQKVMLLPSAIQEVCQLITEDLNWIDNETNFSSYMTYEETQKFLDISIDEVLLLINHKFLKYHETWLIWKESVLRLSGKIYRRSQYYDYFNISEASRHLTLTKPEINVLLKDNIINKTIKWYFLRKQDVVYEVLIYPEDIVKLETAIKYIKKIKDFDKLTPKERLDSIKSFYKQSYNKWKELLEDWEETITQAEAAELCRVSTTLISRAIKDKKIKTKKVGKCVKPLRSSVLEFKKTLKFKKDYPGYLTLTEASKELGFSDNSINSRIKSWEIKGAIKNAIRDTWGSCTLIPLSEVDKLKKTLKFQKDYPDYLTITEASKELGCSDRAIKTRIKSWEIKGAIKNVIFDTWGSCTLIPKSEVDKLKKTLKFQKDYTNYLTLKEVSKELGCSGWTINRRIKSWEIKGAIKNVIRDTWGSCVLIPLSEVDKLKKTLKFQKDYPDYLTQIEVGEELGCSGWTIGNRIKSWEIKGAIKNVIFDTWGSCTLIPKSEVENLKKQWQKNKTDHTRDNQDSIKSFYNQSYNKWKGLLEDTEVTLTLQEAGDLCWVSCTYMFEVIKNKKIKTKKVGSCRRPLKSSVLEFKKTLKFQKDYTNYLTLKEVSKELGCSIDAISERIKSWEIKGVIKNVISNNWKSCTLIPKSEVEKLRKTVKTQKDYTNYLITKEVSKEIGCGTTYIYSRIKSWEIKGVIQNVISNSWGSCTLIPPLEIEKLKKQWQKSKQKPIEDNQNTVKPLLIDNEEPKKEEEEIRIPKEATENQNKIPINQVDMDKESKEELESNIKFFFKEIEEKYQNNIFIPNSLEWIFNLRNSRLKGMGEIDNIIDLANEKQIEETRQVIRPFTDKALSTWITKYLKWIKNIKKKGRSFYIKSLVDFVTSRNGLIKFLRGSEGIDKIFTPDFQDREPLYTSEPQIAGKKIEQMLCDVLEGKLDVDNPKDEYETLIKQVVNNKQFDKLLTRGLFWKRYKNIDRQKEYINKAGKKYAITDIELKDTVIDVKATRSYTIEEVKAKYYDQMLKYFNCSWGKKVVIVYINMRHPYWVDIIEYDFWIKERLQYFWNYIKFIFLSYFIKKNCNKNCRNCKNYHWCNSK